MNAQSSIAKQFSLEALGTTFNVKFGAAAMCRFEELQGAKFTSILQFLSDLTEYGQVSVLTVARLVQAGAKNKDGMSPSFDEACTIIDEVGLADVISVITEAAVAALPTDEAEDGETASDNTAATSETGTGKGGKRGNGKSGPK